MRTSYRAAPWQGPDNGDCHLGFQKFRGKELTIISAWTMANVQDIMYIASILLLERLERYT